MSASPAEPELLTAEVVEPEPTATGRSAAATLRELIAIILMAALADVTLYWGQGYTGVAVFLLGAPVVYALGIGKAKWNWPLWIAVVVLVLFAARLIWLGSPLRLLCGVGALAGVAAALQVGRIDWRAWFLSLQSPLGGVAAMGQYLQRAFSISGRVPMGPIVSIGVPILAVGLFSTLFVLANPDVVTVVMRQMGEFAEALHGWLRVVSPEQVFFWALVALLTAGCLRPLVNLSEVRRPPRFARARAAPKAEPAALYAACRNALWAVIALFSLYLVFEFKTLWFREFPADFYYAGYAHRGAFWLTVALALATAVLSTIFRGEILSDARLPTLRRLAWMWCSLNGLLAIAVYNRLFIYIGFNGLTHMRIIGLFGISAVVAGFVLVVWKIARERDFAWLVSRQIWALLLTIMLYAITPVDSIATSYNVWRIQAGDVSAVMQIGVQPMDTEAILALRPLLDCEHPEIREGVRALLAERYQQLGKRAKEQHKLGWTATQFADNYALAQLRQYRSQWSEFEDAAAREAALEEFRAYAYQWY